MSYLFTFVLGILLLLWFFQVILLQPFYEYNKIEVVKDVASKVAKGVDSAQLEEYMSTLSEQNDLCIRVIGQDDISTGNGGCRLSQLPTFKLVEYVNLAIQNKGTYLVKSDIVDLQFSPDSDKMIETKFNGDRNVIYTKIVDDKDGNNMVILIDTRISRVNAATQALTYQLGIIGLIVTISGAILAIFMAKKIVKPIESINSAATNLAKGEYTNQSNKGDYLEVQELNETLIEAATEVKKADKAKQDLIANVSHDLRTPLTMITGYGEMMIDLPNEKTDENLKVIVDESKRLSLIVNDLLDLSRLNESKIMLDKEEFDITVLIQDVIKTYDQFLKNDDRCIEFDGSVHHTILGDKKRIAQVLHNFINNAINYSENKDKIVIKQTVLDDQLRISIQDFGPGISTEDIEHIWDRYYKIDKEHKRSTQGSGIGLAIVKEILELHKYTYGVDSVVHEGSTFYFETKCIA